MSRQLTDAQIKRKKKVQAYTSIAGGTLGLAALGTRGASVATAGQRAGKLLRIKAHPALSQKTKDWSTGLTTAGAGVGGFGAFNFASYTKAEATKRNRKPVVKSDGGMMDYGLSQVNQGHRLEEVTKAAYVPRHSMPKMPKPAAQKLGQKFHGIVRQPVQAQGMRGQMRTGIKTPFNNPSQKFTPMTSLGNKSGPRTTLQRGSLTPLGKATVGAGGAGAASTIGYQSGQRKERQNMMRGISKAKTKEKPKKPFFPEKSNPSFGRVATGALFPGWHGAVAGKKGRKLEAAAWELGGTIAAPVPLVGGGIGSYAAHKRGALKKQTVKKAYDPERNRQRRLDRYANATNIGAGALGAGAIYHGAGAVNLAGKGRAAEKGKWVTAAGKAKKSNAKAALGYYKSAGKAGARSAAFATGAAGAAIASDRIRRYKKGRGAKYSPLRLTY